MSDMTLQKAASLALLYILCYPSSEAILYPKDSETRTVKSLDGLWDFYLIHSHASYSYPGPWYASRYKEVGPKMSMPVPASYNDITVDETIRDHVGSVRYEKEFFVPENWQSNKRIWLRFGSVCYLAEVQVNGRLATTHEVGHLPFETEITSLVKFGQKNKLVVTVDNTLHEATVPQGKLVQATAGNVSVLQQLYSFDFFNYAGIDRSVHLYTTPSLYISDITVLPNVSGNAGIINYRVDYVEAEKPNVSCSVKLMDKNGFEVAESTTCSGNLTVISPTLWWPFLMHPEPGYLYEMKVEITDGNDRDIYRVKVGIRTLRWTENQLLINERPVYIRGVGKHEDSDIRGKGLDFPLIVKDYNLLKWMGVNTFRTSHYPYAEEIMDMADEMGIMVIDECPSVDTEIFSNTLLEKHKQSLTELIERDKNRPSVIMWSIANEARTQLAGSRHYFMEVKDHVKELDTTRPVTMALAQAYFNDRTGDLLDVICFNRYNAWYNDPGYTQLITPRVVEEATKWHQKYRKPIVMSEYGADAYPGLHTYPEVTWGEEYQVKILEEHFKAFDELRKKTFFIGEMVWNFADFKTNQSYRRVNGNKKGMFTRQRQPKASAFILRARYYELANELDGSSLPNDLYGYTSSANRNLINYYDR